MRRDSPNSSPSALVRFRHAISVQHQDIARCKLHLLNGAFPLFKESQYCGRSPLTSVQFVHPPAARGAESVRNLRSAAGGWSRHSLQKIASHNCCPLFS